MNTERHKYDDAWNLATYARRQREFAQYYLGYHHYYPADDLRRVVGEALLPDAMKSWSDLGTRIFDGVKADLAEYGYTEGWVHCNNPLTVVLTGYEHLVVKGAKPRKGTTYSRPGLWETLDRRARLHRQDILELLSRGANVLTNPSMQGREILRDSWYGCGNGVGDGGCQVQLNSRHIGAWFPFGHFTLTKEKA